MQVYIRKTLKGGSISLSKGHRGSCTKRGGTILLSHKLGTGLDSVKDTLDKTATHALEKVNTQLKKLPVKGRKNIRFMI